MAVLVVEIASDAEAVSLKHFLDKAQFKTEIRFSPFGADSVRFADQELQANEGRNISIPKFPEDRIN